MVSIRLEVGCANGNKSIPEQVRSTLSDKRNILGREKGFMISPFDKIDQEIWHSKLNRRHFSPTDANKSCTMKMRKEWESRAMWLQIMLISRYFKRFRNQFVVFFIYGNIGWKKHAQSTLTHNKENIAINLINRRRRLVNR